MCEGIAAELTGIDLGDVRLNRRSQALIEALAADPAASINAACGGWGDTMAAYRFFDNDSVTPEQILEPHREATRQRIAEHPVVLVVQDTTELDFTDHPQKDAGCLNTEKRFGFYDHTHLAVTPDRLCLGVVGTEQYSRTPESLGKTVERKSLPIEQKESMRWLTGYRLAAQLSAECPGTQIVSVGDPEADIYDIFLEAEGHETPADFVIRGKEDRSTLERNPEAVRLCTAKCAMKSVPRRCGPSDRSTFPERPNASRAPPNWRSALSGYDQAAAHAIVSAERDLPGCAGRRRSTAPATGRDVSWLLITTLRIDTVEDVLRVIDYYVARWTIEIYFRILKTGCRVEEIQLETGQSHSELPDALQDHCVACVVADVPESSLPVASLRCCVLGERMEVGLDHHAEDFTAEAAAVVVSVHRTSGGSWRLQQPGHGTGSRSTTDLDWHPPNDRLRARLGHLPQREQHDLRINDRASPQES